MIAMARPRIGLALGSGSARGWSHIGIIESLTEAGIEPAIVCGTSIGSLVGAAYIAGRLGELRQWAVTATWREVVGLIDVRLSGGGLIDGKLIIAFLRGLGITEASESYAKAYAAIATDLVSGREIWLQSGPIDEAVRASISLPGIFSPAPDRRQMASRWRAFESGPCLGLEGSGSRCNQLISRVIYWGGSSKNFARKRRWSLRLFQMNL
jgi:predicted acylesterase/phospholipase RssA